MSSEQKQEFDTQEASVGASECTHHWVIDTPMGAVSGGVCKRCGEEREFKNYLENSPYWEDDVSLNQVSSGARFRTGAAPASSPDAGDE